MTSRITARAARCRFQHGFTLIELMLVTILIALLASVVVPRLSGSVQQRAFVDAAERLAAMARQGRVEALRRQRFVRLVLVGEEAYRLEIQSAHDPTGQQYEPLELAGGSPKHELPKGVSAKVVGGRAGDVAALAESSLIFSPSGVGKKGEIELSNGADEIIRLSLGVHWDEVYVSDAE